MIDLPDPQSMRLKGWDYTAAGWYFVTICTQSRTPYFGEVLPDQVRLSSAGLIADQEWRRAAEVRGYLRRDAFIIMPNHIHGILILEPQDAIPSVGASQRDARQPWRLRAATLGSIVGQIKSRCTKRIRATCLPTFAWQRGYYDHIIRDEADLNRIRQYIADNPGRWHLDRYFVAN